MRKIIIQHFNIHMSFCNDLCTQRCGDFSPKFDGYIYNNGKELCINKSMYYNRLISTVYILNNFQILAWLRGLGERKNRNYIEAQR